MTDGNAESAQSMETAEIADIMRLLPHRYPFLLVDRVISMRQDEFGIGVKNVTINEHFFAGHFPGEPIMPGVLQIEGMAQTAGVLCMSLFKSELRDQKIFFMTIDRARFRRPVLPGDTVHYEMTKLRRRLGVWKYRGEAKVNGTLVAEAEISALLTGVS